MMWNGGDHQYVHQVAPPLQRDSSQPGMVSSSSGYSTSTRLSNDRHAGPSASGSSEKAEFIMQKPDDREIEQMFAELMNKRDFLGLPGGNLSDEYKEAARKNMMSFPINKKWMLVYNDKFTEFHAEKEKERTRRNYGNNQSGSSPVGGLVISRNSPEWYIKKFMDGSVNTKHIESLAVTLRTCAMGWVENFVDAKGTPVLASFLSGLHAKGVKNENDMALEYETLKAFRSLFNSKAGANDALHQPKCVNSIVHSVVSSHLATRKQAADILLFLCHWAIPAGHRLVLRGFDELKTSVGDHSRFDAWFRVFEQTIDGRGQMGSRVGASEEVRKLSMVGHQESSLNEYAVNNMFLVNAILSARIVSEYEIRVHLRNQMDASGLQRILIKLRAFKNPDLDRQLDEYEKGAESDHENVVESFNKDVLTDMSDPVDVFKAIIEKTSGSRAYDFFLSALQHLLLIKQEGDGLVHYYQLIDSLVTAVVMDRKGSVEGSDMSSLLGVSVNNVLSRFADQDEMNATREELSRVKAEARLAEQERAKLEEQVNESSEGLVGRLQAQIESLEDDLAIARGNTSGLQQEMEEMEKGYIERIVALEIQIRELYEMLREAQGNAEMIAANTGNMDRQQLVDTLEKQMERNKTIRKLEANARKAGKMPPLSGSEEEEAIRKEEKRLSRKRMSSLRRKSIQNRSSQANAGDDLADMPQTESPESSSDSESDLDPTSEAARWKIQATLAAGMAKNTELQSRMTDARETRRRKGSRGSAKSGGENAALASLDVDGAPPPPPPPPPPPFTGADSGTTFLDEIRKRKDGGTRNLRSTSFGSHSTVGASMGPPPPPPPPPLPPMAAASRQSSVDSEAPPPPPPPPPPVPGAPPAPITQQTPPSLSNSVMMSTPNASESARDSMLNVRASYAGDFGPSGPAHAPPAPPIPGFFVPSVTTRKEVLETAKGRMKQLQWDKLTPQHAAETVWGKNLAEEERLTLMLKEEGLFDEMEEDFKAKQAAKRATTSAKKDKVELKTHLTLQTRQGIEMVLRRVKSSLTEAKHATPEEVAHHIVNCNEAVLDQSFLTELLRHYPESETKGQLGEYRNASDEELRLLHPADRLVVLLMTVPHLKEKVKGLLYMTKYREAIDLIKEGSLKIREGSEALIKAPNFAKLLSLVLMMGNYLNSTGVQGGAFGFKISSINKLVDTKASDGTTLLHFVERSINRCFPESEAFLDELEKPSEACRVQLFDLKRDLAELKSGSVQHKKELDRFLDEAEERLEDPYTKLMLPFLNEAQQELTRISDQVQFTERTYVEALRYFGEGPDPKRRGFPAQQAMRTEDFFGIFREFQTAYRKVKVDNVKIGEMRSAEAKRRAAAAEREKERLEAAKRKEAGVDDSAVLETLLGNLRSGGVTPKRKRNARGEKGRVSVTKDPSAAAGGAGANGIDGNPSDVAQAMLARLQGGAGGDTGSGATASSTSSSYAGRRRRDRRTTGGASTSESVRDSTIDSVSAAHQSSRFSQVTSAADLDEQQEDAKDVGDDVGREGEEGEEEEEEEEEESLQRQPLRELSSSEASDYDVDERQAADRVASLSLQDMEGMTVQDEQALQQDESFGMTGGAEGVLDQGDWFDPDDSGFMNTSSSSLQADQTLRPS